MQNLVIELDAKVVVELVQSMSSFNAFYSLLLADCRSLLDRFQHYKVQYAFREVNRVVDALAKLGCVMQDHFVILNSIPMLFHVLFSQMLMGTDIVGFQPLT